MSNSTKTDHAARLLAHTGTHGLTWREYAEQVGCSFGAATGMFSRMHAAGRAVRLTERRNNASVYCDPDFAGDRETISPVTPKAQAPPEQAADVPVTEQPEPVLTVVPEPEPEPEPPVAHEPEPETQLQVPELLALIDALVLEFEAERAARETLRKGREAMRKRMWREAAKLREQIDTLRAEMTLSGQREREAAVAEAYSEGRTAGMDEAWQTGYEEGMTNGRDANTAFADGQALGRDQGEELVRKRVAAVSTEMLRVIQQAAPLRSHFNGCYQIHPECAVKALTRSAGIVPVRRGLASAV
jgi:hypothetical protein